MPLIPKRTHNYRLQHEKPPQVTNKRGREKYRPRPKPERVMGIHDVAALAVQMRAWRDKRRVTLKQAGEILGVNHRTLETIERAKQSKFSFLIRNLLDALDTIDKLREEGAARQRKPIPLLHTVTRIEYVPAPSNVDKAVRLTAASTPPASTPRASTRTLPSRAAALRSVPIFE